jgi:hypothetical protein
LWPLTIHGSAFSYAGANHVPDSRTPEIVKESAKGPGLFAGGRPNVGYIA